MTVEKTQSGLCAEAVSWRVGERTVLENLSFCALPGEITGVLGVNGSGKSTLLKLLAGLQPAAGGRVWLEGREIAAFSARERARRIAFLEQSAPGAFALPVKEAVLLGRLAHIGRWRGFGTEDRRLAGQAMELVGISHLADRDWQRLSGGERQRVHLARALAQQTPWLLLDEPANHLDIAHQQQFMALLRRLKLSVVVTLHDLNLAACYCDRVALLQRGGICAAGTPQQALTPEHIRAVYGVEARLAAPDGYAPPLIYYPAAG
ncbi:histidinol-phosphatase [Serratia marcescens]|uniref:ABC transporter ATP-binding protein n=1 Tax=Serratia TaxID=613 RepID=UPI000EFB2713|nr:MULTISPECIES: ABC transporter ATP-binding protein [Serratia]MBF4189912.1 ABC transporter ATP-binding protein [Serratia ureilytica]MBF8439643.1 ABC transporter ATP-binding protein [Serratia ureilytica]MBF8446343.1 ABC transporter ATP-binding protein [Serratia ureilytica]MBH2800050.1 ABC transporter ATP-binding protein [Serratia ureilytica]MBH2820094.1 ABC transporter ATP-binding protein [Serratia ureilytica]